MRVSRAARWLAGGEVKAPARDDAMAFAVKFTLPNRLPRTISIWGGIFVTDQALISQALTEDRLRLVKADFILCWRVVEACQA